MFAAIVDLERRRWKREDSSPSGPSHNARAPKDRSTERLGTIERILDESATKELSLALPRALRLAKETHNTELERWVRIELYGYNVDGGMQETDLVPEYRSVTGRWICTNGRALDLSDYPDLAIVNQLRLRFGVRKLEELAKKTDMICLVHDEGRRLIRMHMQTEVAQLCFSPVEAVGVLDAIRNLLCEKVLALRDSLPPSST